MKSIEAKDCRQDDLLLHYYGELDPQRRRELEAHLEVCAGCAEQWRQLRHTLDKVPRPTIELAPGESSRFAAKVATRAHRSERSKRWVWGGALAATAVLALSLVFRPPGVAPGRDNQLLADVAVIQELELLQNMEMLEELQLFQEFEGQG